MSTILLALRVLVSLGVVVALLWFVQRRTNRWSAKRKTSSTVSLIARKSLGSKTNLVVIEVEGTRFVLGVSEHSVSVLQSAPAVDPVVADAPVVSGRMPAAEQAAGPIAGHAAAAVAGRPVAVGGQAAAAVAAPAAVAGRPVAASVPVSAPAFEDILARESAMRPDGEPVTGAAEGSGVAVGDLRGAAEGSGVGFEGSGGAAGEPDETEGRPSHRPQPRPSQPRQSPALPHREFSGFSGSIVSLETWKQAARALRGPRWP